METVFISYSHKDSKWVRDWLLPRLEAAGVQVSIDFRDFQIGMPTIKNIEKTIKECKRTFMVITPNWIESRWSNFESLILRHDDPNNEKLGLIPLLLEPCELPKHLAILTLADFTDKSKWDTELGRLLEQMGVSYSSEGSMRRTYLRPTDEAVSLYKLPTTGKELFGRKKNLGF